MVGKAQTYTPTHTCTQLRIASGSVVGPGITWESEKELSELTLYIVPRYVYIIQSVSEVIDYCSPDGSINATK